MRLSIKRMGSIAVVAALALCLAGCAKADEQTQAVIDRIDARADEQTQAVIDRIDAKADEQTQAVIDRIDAIGEVTLGSKADIESIRKDYDKLPDDQAKFVENADVLESAESELSALEVSQCSEAIDAIGEVTLDSEADVESARIGYDKLTADQKESVENLDVLELAESKLSSLKVNRCVESIDAIGEVTTDSRDAVDAAYLCFVGLTSEERELVTNKATLDGARETLRTLEAGTKKTASSSKSYSSSKKSPSTKEETGRYYDPKTGGTLYTYSDGTEEYTDGWGNAVRGKNGKADEYTTDGGETWHKYKD